MGADAGPKLCDHKEFHSQWALQQQTTIHELQQALDGDSSEEQLQHAVDKATTLYESYYNALDATAKHDVLQVVSPSWKTPLEKAFMWLGEWRPSAAYQLVYALAGQKVEEELAELLKDIETPSLASLSVPQLAEISNSQIRTLKEERKLQHELAAFQQSVVDQPTLNVAQSADIHGGSVPSGELPGERRVGNGTAGPYENGGLPVEGAVQHRDGSEVIKGDVRCRQEARDRQGPADCLLEMAISDKLKRLEELSLAADALRRRTLADILGALTTVQRAQFLLASSQLQVAVRHVGERFKNMADGNIV